jgi:galactose oxidase
MHALHAVAIAVAFLASPCTAQDPALPRASWYATASGSEFPAANAPGKVLDGNLATLWHSAYTPAFDALPHTITVVFGGATNKVSGLIYRPRGDGGVNGRIGKYEIRLSTNGETFPAATVATGTFADTAAQKTVAFAATNAKAIQLKALSEAGGRGPWSSVGEILVLGKPVTAASKKQVGAWGGLIPFPLVPVAAAVLPGGKVLPSCSFWLL